MNSFPTSETNFLLPGPAGNLELLATPVEEAKRQAKVAIVCHPHPLHGGTMNNKVVSTLARTFRDLGLPTVRFNFRGVGKSEGKFADGVGETEDLLAVVEWIKKIYPENEIWLSGFSFGAFVAANAAEIIKQNEPENKVEKLITVAPQVSRFININLQPSILNWILVVAEQDEIIPLQETLTWVENLPHKPTVIRIPTAGHFFHGQLLELRKRLSEE